MVIPKLKSHSDWINHFLINLKNNYIISYFVSPGFSSRHERNSLARLSNFGFCYLADGDEGKFLKEITGGRQIHKTSSDILGSTATRNSEFWFKEWWPWVLGTNWGRDKGALLVPHQTQILDFIFANSLVFSLKIRIRVESRRNLTFFPCNKWFV